MTLTLADFFCGAGGSSTGAIQVPNVSVKVAANHWQLAIDTHNTNHQQTDHICADLSQFDPRYFPRTDLGWFSPECTWHTIARGGKPDLGPDLFGDGLPPEAAIRSRATMWDVVRFSEHHRYRAVIVENVYEITRWPPFHAWLAAMQALGYRHRTVSLNSMHAQAFGPPAPQSRDRVYVVFWRSGDTAPDLDKILRPKAWCGRCDAVVESRQAWKPGRTVGRYRSQYGYACHLCGDAVQPGWLPAASIIDWSLLGERIGDRTKPLADKTRVRIAAGIARYWGPLHLEAAGNTYDAADPKHPQHGNPNSYYRAWSMEDPLRTLHTIESKALAVPVEGRDGKAAKPLDEALRTQTTRAETGLAFLLDRRFEYRARSLDDPLSTITATDTSKALVTPFVAELRGGGSTARSTDDPLATVCAGSNHHALITSYYGNSDSAQPVTEPVGTVTTVDRHALIMRNNTGGAEMITPAGEPVRTITTTGHQSLLTADNIAKAAAQVDDVRFRMLEPDECKRAMAFPAEYIMLGNRREQVRLAGNAVTPPAARDLIAAVVEALG